MWQPESLYKITRMEKRLRRRWVRRAGRRRAVVYWRAGSRRTGGSLWTISLHRALPFRPTRSGIGASRPDRDQLGVAPTYSEQPVLRYLLSIHDVLENIISVFGNHYVSWSLHIEKQLSYPLFFGMTGFNDLTIPQAFTAMSFEFYGLYNNKNWASSWVNGEFNWTKAFPSSSFYRFL